MYQKYRKHIILCLAIFYCFKLTQILKWVVQKLQSTAATEAVVTKFADFKIAQNFEHYVTKVTKVVTVIHSY